MPVPLSDLKFTVASFWKTVRSSSYLSAMDPDLGRFERSGGRLLLWHGYVLTPVMAWVESGRQPGTIVASKVANGTVTRTRPVYPYPTVARYDGTGSVDDAANFRPATPRQEPPVGYHWLGERLYSGDYQTRYAANGTRLVCRPSRTWLTARENG
ncbi:hypothetical protein GCM10023191_090320 [Actinoallomurus oryzae]|uniref:Uncharacterized protein n=1 Tax=Actinoallomurus oryzae TaxID=502180 RepID=A0ABP8R3X4_9ACTN